MAKRSNNSLGRRSHGGKPYDANNSFVKKMANKVTDFIPQRSWISKWFNTSQDNGDMSNNIDNPEDGEPDEEMRQPPLKRPRIRMDITHPPGTFSIEPRSRNLSNNDNDSTKDLFSHGNELGEDFLEPPAAGPSGVRRFVSSTPAVQGDVRNSNAQTTVLNSLIPPRNNGTTNGADDNSESSESTSGCSSLIPQTNRQEGPLKSNYNSTLARRKRFIDKTSFTNHLQSPRSLFLDSGSRESLSSRRPSFNASMINNTLERTSSLSSPFYSGNVTFGGANALSNIKRSRSLFNNSSSEFQLQVPRRTNVQVKPSNPESMDSSGMSQTAKRILEAMEYFSSPISDAKKIPLKNSPNLSTTSTGKKRSRDEDVTVPASRVGLRHLTRELAVPTVPDLLKLRRRQKLQDTTVAARKIVSSRGGPPPSSSTTQSTASEEYHLRTELDVDPKFHGKLRTKSKKNPGEEEPVPTVNLPSISLPITSLPSFDIPLPKYTKPATSQKSTENPNTEDSTGFKFASPIKVSESSWNLKSINNFSFSKPLNANSKDFDGSRDADLTRTLSVESNVSSGSFIGGASTNFIWSGSSTAPRLKAKNKSNERENNNTNKSLSTEAATELKTGSVMDILGGKSATGTGSELGLSPQKKNTSQMFSFGAGSKPLTSIWECAECYIKNDSSETVCVACKAAKPSATKMKDSTKVSSAASNVVTPEQPRNVTSDCFGSQFKISNSQWECQSCLVRNKETNLKCVSCTAPKPENKETATETGKSPSSPSVNSDLMDKFKPPEGSWECPGCMLRNPCTLITCPCCSASKPSLLKVSPKKNTFNNSQLLDKFKPTSSSWECSSCLVRNNETANSCVCCSSPKPNATSSKSNDGKAKVNDAKPFTTSEWGDKFKKPEGSWSCDSCLVQNKPELTECAACGGVKPGAAPKTVSSTVSFGIPTGAQNFKFGIDNNGGKTTSETNLASSNGFSFGTKPPSSDATTAATQFSFGIPKDANKTVNPEESPVKPTGFVFASPKTADSGGFKFGVNKFGEKSPETDSTTKTLGSAEESKKASTFSFGLPISTGEKRRAVEEQKPTNFGASADSASSSKPSFVFGIQKSDSNQVDAIKSVPKITASTGDSSTPKSSGFGSEGIQPIKQNDSGDVQANSTKSNTPGSEQQPAATIFSSLTNTSTTASSLPTETPSPFTFSEPKSKLSQPTFSSTFGQSSGNASAPITSSTFASGVPNSSENKLNTESEKKQSIIGFSIGSTTASTVMPSPAPAVATPSFGISPSPSPLLGGNAIETRPTASPAFGSTENNATLFGMPTINKTPTFGTVETKTPTFATMENNSTATFGTSDKPAASPMFNSPSPAFGVPVPASQPIFGSSTNSVFGNNSGSVFGTTPSSATPNIFAAAKPSATPAPANTGLFTFGASAAQSTTTSGFGFSGNANCETNKLMFGFGSTASTQQSSECFGSGGASTAGAFGTPASVNPTPSTGFTFNAPPKQEPPAFGQGATPISGIFGAQPATASIAQAPQSASTFAPNTPAASTGFNFAASASAPTTVGFNFSGAMNRPATAPTGSFNFTAPSASPTIAFDPNTRPSFNFTGGSAPPAFNATPQAAAAGRKIKKAVRRMPQR